MSQVGGALSSGMSWLMDDVLGIPVDNSPALTQQQIDSNAAPPGGAPAPAQPQMAPAEVPAPITPQAPQIQINTSSGMDAAKAEAATTPSAPPPPAFGSAPGRKAGRTKSPGSPSTFLGSSALPQRRAAAGGFGFDKQSSGSKTLIGT